MVRRLYVSAALRIVRSKSERTETLFMTGCGEGIALLHFTWVIASANGRACASNSGTQTEVSTTGCLVG